jgi:hypothetical protein
MLWGTEGASVRGLPALPQDEVVVHWGILSDRLDASKIEQLRAWGTGLTASGGDDLRATGKAILMLIEEIERLHIDLWNAKSTQRETAAEVGNDASEIADGALIERTLRDRLSPLRGRK